MEDREILELHGPWFRRPDGRWVDAKDLPKEQAMVKTYDQASYDLAEHFMQDEPCRADPELYKRHCDSLAKHIQQAIEDWFVTPGN